VANEVMRVLSFHVAPLADADSVIDFKALEGMTIVGVALRALGISRGDVMSYSVRGDRVVIIEGPVGYKRVWEAPGAKGGDDGGRAG
jgi:hypothetical protein